MRKLTVFLLSLALLLGLAVSSYAAQIPDTSRNASLTLEMDWEGKPLDSGSLTLYRVGDIALDNGNAAFVLIPALADSGVSLNDLEDTNLPQMLAQLAVQKKLEPITAEIKNGKAVFPNLVPGLFVVTQSRTDACDGFEPIRPFLISLPRWNGSHYVYELTASPKVSLETEPTEPTETEPPKPTEPYLPQTGQLNWPVPAMAAAGLAFLVLGWHLCFGKKERHET